ncbi:helix-turn-helix domain-containing protein [Gordonibacter massiliensis (ex Traore et al. 2017)]|uniref:helix-turn-helix domain-containing protein n=1 Tax=Gordonibacter massiliensis (ex Traore et al. 2017) TaxID=1841863 RepID=UPI001C8D90F3|nr:helix-turn-helix transcriptional regulator [Gordonibacter massiliensis (ex Traore et al. 2017)]
MDTILAHNLGLVDEMQDIRFKRLGKAIREKREEQGLAQQQLAKMIGHSNSHTYITRVEKGQIKIGLEQLMKIADALGVRVDDLIDF